MEEHEDGAIVRIATVLHSGGECTTYPKASTLFRGHGIDVRISGRKISEVNLAG